LPTGTLVEYRHELRRVARHGVRAELAVSSSATSNYRGLEHMLERIVGKDDAPIAAQRLTAGVMTNAADALASLHAQWDTYCDVCSVDDVARAVYDGPVDQTDNRLRALGEPGLWLLRILDERLRAAGSRGVYGGETWAEARGEVWTALRRSRGLNPDRAFAHDRIAAVRDDGANYLKELTTTFHRSRRVKRLLTGQLIDIRRRLLRQTVTETTESLRAREAAKAALLRLGGEERRVVQELARRIVDAGGLDHVDDVELLTDDELDRLATTGSGVDHEEIARRRAALDAAHGAGPLPDVFEGAPDRGVPSVDTRNSADDVLTGWATSPGQVRAPARVVKQSSDASALEPGEILVAHTTDPSWTPLFLMAGGIVTEQGGPLSHAAIIARELRLPAVLNVQDATTRIATGEAITVDGTAGTIQIPNAISEETT
jgi:pyruvate,water dikinase